MGSLFRNGLRCGLVDLGRLGTRDKEWFVDEVKGLDGEERNQLKEDAGVIINGKLRIMERCEES